MQPIPKKIKDKNPELIEKDFNTLLVDGSNLLELSFHGYKSTSSNGNEVGGIFQFLLQLKILLKKGNFRYVYVFWDGDNSGQKRYDIYPLYKLNRDKTFDDDNLSEYMKKVNEKVRIMQEKAYSTSKKKTNGEKELFHWQRDVVMACMEELFVRQCIFDEVEADDLISYYVTHKKPNERIVIMSNDRDLTQLIGEKVIIYIQSMGKFINTKNHLSEIGYDYRNVVLKKVICGDTSDNIKGIKGVGEKILLNNFDEIKHRKVTIDEVVEKAAKINEDRIANKKKPFKWAENIVGRITDGVQGEHIYDINERIIDLCNPKCPMMTKESKEALDDMMYAPIDPEGRSMENLYRILCDNGIDELRDETKFSNFFVEYKYLIDKEKKNV